MTILLRVLSIVVALIAALFLFMSGFSFLAGEFGIRTTLTALAFLALGALTIRCVKWLWRSKRFWTERRSLREMSTLAVAVVLIPLVVFVEGRTSLNGRDIVHFVYIAVIIAVYLIVRRYARSPRQAAGEP